MSLGEAGPRCVARWVGQTVQRGQGSWAPRQELGFSSEGTAVCVVLSRIPGSEPRTLALGVQHILHPRPCSPTRRPLPSMQSRPARLAGQQYIGGAQNNSDRNEPSIISQVSQATSTGSHRCPSAISNLWVVHKLCGGGQCWNLKAAGT